MNFSISEWNFLISDHCAAEEDDEEVHFAALENVQNSTPTKPKKRALMSQKPKPASILSEELGTSKSTTIDLKRAREAYLSDPVPSTSESKAIERYIIKERKNQSKYFVNFVIKIH